MGQENNQDKKLIPLQLNGLKIINKISFTNREIDIIACLLGGKDYKKIGSFLDISPKTVEMHIHNIMLKIGCNSRNNIIDFIEKSNKFSLIKQHYADLLINSIFELELRKIVSLNKHCINCIILYHTTTRAKDYFVNTLEKHLNSAGIKTKSKTYSNKFTKPIPSPANNSQVDHVLHVISNEFIEKFKANEYHLEKISELITEDNAKSNIVILNNNVTIELDIKKINFECIDFRDNSNYYFLVFELLKKLCPSIVFEKNIMEFKRKCTALSEPFKEADFKTNNLLLEKKTNSKLYNLIKRKTKTLLASVTICLFICAIYVFVPHDYLSQNKTNKLQQDTVSSLNNVVINESSLAERIANKEQISWNLPRQDHLFVQRQKLLDELDVKLHTKEAKSNKPVIVSVCAGLGGVGKTQLALQYITHSMHPYTIKAWFQAENLDQLQQQYITFATALGYKTDKYSIETVISYVKEWLLKNPKWLLVFDNVNNYEEIKNFLPESGGEIILTTRHRIWPSGFKMLDIGVMNEEEAINLMQSLIKRQIIATEKIAAKDLVKLLGYLPLALAQASAYIQHRQITIAEYLVFYKQHQQELLADNTMPEGTDSIPVAITWDLSLEAIVQEAKINNKPALELDLLSVCAYLAPERIPRSLLLTWLKECYPNLVSPELELSKLIGHLWEYSMLHLENNGDVTIHSLVQTVIRQQHKRVGGNKKLNYSSLTLKWYGMLLKSAHDEFSFKTQILADEARQKNLLPHLQKLLNNYKLLWPNNSEDKIVSTLNDIGTAFYILGELGVAKSYFERALPMLEQHYGKEHVEVFSTIDSLGRSYRHLGNAYKSKELHDRVLKMKEQHYGKEHVEVAFTLDYLGRSYRDLGDFKKAKELHERALKVKELHYGTEHYEVSISLDYLGCIYRDLGDFKQAKELHEHALKIQENYFSTQQINASGRPMIALTLEELGSDYRALGDAKNAKVLQEKALHIKEQYYGKNHFETAKTLTSLGSTYIALNIIAQGKTCLDKALIIQEQYYGKDHPKITETLVELGIAYKALKNPLQAKIFLERALKIREQYFGKTHALTMEVKHVMQI